LALLQNGNCAIRRSVWEEFHYDETLTGQEDLDWAERVQAAGWNISYAADAGIIHVHDETPTEVFNRYRREAIAYKRIMDDETFTLVDFIQTFVLNTASDYLAAAQQGELFEHLVAIPRFRFQQFWGTYRGFSREKPVPERLRRRFYYPDTNGGTDGGETDTGTASDLLIQYGDPDEFDGPLSGIGEGND
jgi:GT2 family glycosyltransferase